MSRNLSGAAGRGAAVTLGTQVLRLLVQVAGLTVLGRLLAPQDYGLVAIITVLVAAGEVFRDFGLSAAAIQAKTLTAGQRTNLFWINTGIGVVLALLLCAASPLLAHIYRDDRLVLIAVVMSGIFVLNGLSTQFRAGLARDLSFGRLSGAELTGQVVGVAVAVAVAVLGGGYWALAVQWLSAQVVALVLVVTWSDWLPGRVDRQASVRPFLRYGSALLGSTLLTNAVDYAPPLALGITTTPVHVGVYNRAQQLVTMQLAQIQAPVTRVALPVLSRMHHDDKGFASMLLRGQLMLLSLIGLLFATVFAQAPAVVHILLGTQWGATVPLFRLLLIAGFFQAATYAASWVFQARALTGSQFRYTLLTRPFFVVAIVVGALWGPHGVAIAYTSCLVLAWPLSLLWLRRLGGVPTGRMLGNGLQAGVLSAGAALASFAVTRALDLTALMDIIIGGLVSLLVLAAVVAAVPRHRRDAVRAVRAARSWAGQRRRRAVAPSELAIGAVGLAETTVDTAPTARGTGLVPAQGRGDLPQAPTPSAGPPVVRVSSSRALGRAKRVGTRLWSTSGVPGRIDEVVAARALRIARRSRPADAAPGAGGDRRHLVIAAPGQGNVGDQALLEALLEGTTLPVLLAVPHGAVPDLPAAVASRVELLDAPDLVYGRGIRHLASVQTFGAALARVGHVSVIGADVMDGGYSLPASLRRSSLATVAARAGVDTRVIGFSWKSGARPAAARALRRAGRSGVALLVRDPVSATRLRTLGVTGLVEVADVVFTARSVDDSVADALLAGAEEPLALVNVSGLIASRSALVDDMVAVVAGLRDRGLRVVLLPHVLRTGTDDLLACRAVASHFASGEVDLVTHQLQPAQVRGLARRARVVVTGRMHLSVMSFMAGVPAVTLATQGKVEGLAQLVGAPQLAVDPAPGFAHRVLDLVDAARCEDSSVRAEIGASLPHVRALAARNLRGLGPSTDLAERASERLPVVLPQPQRASAGPATRD